MNAASASGLCARRIVCGALTTTRRLRGGRRRRLLVERIEILRVLAVLGTLARTLGSLVLEEVGVRPARTGGVALHVERTRPQHESEEVRGDGPADGVRLGQGACRVAAGQ